MMLPETMDKMWGAHKFWGVGFEWDPQWFLTESQRQLQVKLIQLCKNKLRPVAIEADKTYEFPRQNMNALAELGLLGLIVPKELGGLGENHVCATMVTETIARYGCPSTAMIYVMHIGVVAVLLLRHHDNERVKDILRRLDKDKLVGTSSLSDPASGGHIWRPLSAKIRDLGDSYRIFKYVTWTTSAGFADFYLTETLSPGAGDDNSNLSVFLIYGDEVRANTSEWSALGLRGNQSGPMIIEGIFNKDRMVGPIGDGALSNSEVLIPYFLFTVSACWNGVSMGAIDIAKKHVTRKAHADMGIRVCDYPTIQDYFGEALSETNISRMACFSCAGAMDKVTDNNNWALHSDVTFAPRVALETWLWQLKVVAAGNVDKVTTKMLRACGGTGYKTDLGLERYLRDGKAGWVMGASNEVLRQWIGKAALLGKEANDLWEQRVNDRVLNQEIKKLSISEKEKLAEVLLRDVATEKEPRKAADYQDQDFDNPFNTRPPQVYDEIIKTKDGVLHKPALNPETYVQLKLIKVSKITQKMSSFVFAFPDATDHSGCLPGQYVQIRIPEQSGYRSQERYFSPVSQPHHYGEIQLVIRYETCGILSNYFRKLQIGDEVEFRGPIGGFEYHSNTVDTLSMLASGGGITPCLQLIRTIVSNPEDKTKVILLYYSENYDEILFKDELDKYQKDPRVMIIHSLGEAPEDWTGEEGFLDIDMVKKYIPPTNGKTHKIVLCGGTTMTVSILYSLKEFGIKSEQVFVFGVSGVEQVRIVYGKNCELGSHTSKM